MFVVSIDGPDGSGKTTVANLLLNELRQRFTRFKIIRTELPSQMVTGTFTKILRNSADTISPEVFALTYAADHLHHWQEFMQGLPKDSIVVQERSLLSTIIYQGILGKIDMKWLKEINKYCPNRPDLTIILRVPMEIQITREFGESGHDIFEKRDHVEKQTKVYYDLPEDLKNEYSAIVVDGSGTPAEVAKRCADIIEKAVKVKGI